MFMRYLIALIPNESWNTKEFPGFSKESLDFLGKSQDIQRCFSDIQGEPF